MTVEELSYLVKNQIIKPPQVDHSDPSFYGMTEAEIHKIKTANLKEEKRYFQEICNEFRNIILRCEIEWLKDIMYEYYEEVESKLKKTNFRLKFAKEKKEIVEKYDVTTLKTIPIDRVVDINSAGFFINNPFRSEQSPSNSLHWDKRSNRWFDFGTGENGDVIDLVMVIHRCDFKEACRILSIL